MPRQECANLARAGDDLAHNGVFEIKMAKSNESAERIEGLIERIRSDIRLGVFEFGQPLRLIDLQNKYSASQFLARQALVRLQSLKVVEHRQNSGFRVCEQDSAGPSNLRFVRLTLERSAGPLVVARATPDTIMALRALAGDFAASIEGGKREEINAANIEFHRRLYRTAGNPLMTGMIDDLRAQSYIGTTGRWRSREGLLASSAEHYAMVDAIERKDPTDLDHLIFRHIQSF
jgi:DNA-binding GntR family transcriptional regulator